MYFMSEKELYLIKDVRILWTQHSEWTFMAVQSLVLDTPNKDEVLERLLRNPKDFASLLKIFYGYNFADEFDTLLTEHLTLAADWINAIIIYDEKNSKRIRYRWYENAEEISSLLDSVNPYWLFKYWKDMFFMHLKLIEKMTFEIINGNYEESIKTYDVLESEVMEMADYMYEGILRQFY